MRSTSTPVDLHLAVTSCMTAIDTNVLVYSLDRNDVAKRAKARALIRRLRSRPDEVIIPWQVMGKFLRYLRTEQDRGDPERADFEETPRSTHPARSRRMFAA